MKIIQYSIISLLLILSACGGNKVVKTADDSADYQSARQLPPLKKNVNSANPSVVTSNSGTKIAARPIKSNKAQQNITFSIIDVSKNRKRIKIDAQFDSAWTFLLGQLRKTAITIHSRNKSAARVEVGCGAIDDGASLVNAKGWSILNKEKLVYDYCAMKLDEKGDATIVSIHNRRGEEVTGAEAMKLIDKLNQK